MSWHAGHVQAVLGKLPEKPVILKPGQVCYGMRYPKTANMEGSSFFLLIYILQACSGVLQRSLNVTRFR